MNWITVKLMKYQLRKAKKQLDRQDNPIMQKAFSDMVTSYKTTIMFLKSNS